MGREHCHDNLQHYERHHSEESGYVSISLNLLSIHSEPRIVREPERIVRFDQGREARPHVWNYEHQPRWSEPACYPQPGHVPEIRLSIPIYGYLQTPTYAAPIAPSYNFTPYSNEQNITPYYVAPSNFEQCRNQIQGVPPGYFDDNEQSQYAQTERLSQSPLPVVTPDVTPDITPDITPELRNLPQTSKVYESSDAPSALAPAAEDPEALVADEDKTHPYARAAASAAGISTRQDTPITLPHVASPDEITQMELNIDPARQKFFDEHLLPLNQIDKP